MAGTAAASPNPTMKVPTVGGKISTSKPEQTSGSTLKSAAAPAAVSRGGAKAVGRAGGGGATQGDGAGQTYKAIANLGKRQSESLMDVTIIKNRSGGGCGGGAGEGMNAMAEVAAPPPADEEEGGGASPEVGDRRQNYLARDAGAAHDGGQIAEEDVQVIGQQYENYFRSPSRVSQTSGAGKGKGFGGKFKHCLRK